MLAQAFIPTFNLIEEEMCNLEPYNIVLYINRFSIICYLLISRKRSEIF
jgi:hypothetical protein